MTQNAYKLLRIILIDSFWKKQVNELDLTGHTQLEGTNGAGKTSLMRLLPLFYGMRPSDIVSKVDQAKNFADYYLPRDTSLLVYEYQRPYGQICMVLASSDGRAVHYKLIDSAYDSALFIKDKKRLSINEIERGYRTLGAFCSCFLAVDKYRQVIQNLRSGRKIKDIRQLQGRFAFGDSAIPHIDKVVNGTIEKNLDFDAVKRMLVEIASDHLARNNMDEKEQISLNKEEISDWLADIQASRAIQKVANKIALWQTDFGSIDGLLIKLQHLHFEIIHHQQKLQVKQTTYNENKQKMSSELTLLEAELQKKSTTFTHEISKLNAQIEADQSRINLLDEDKLSYEENNAASFQLQADQAGRFQQELNEVNEVIAAFEGNISKIQQKFEKLIAQVTQQKMVDVAANKEQRFLVKEQAAVQLSCIAETYQGQLTTLNEQLNATYLKLNMEKQALAHDQQQLEIEQKNPIIESELLRAIEENQLHLSDTQDKQSDILEQQNELNSRLSLLESQRTKLLDKHKQEGAYLEKIKNQRQDVECQLVPQVGSLQYFLTHEPKAALWKETIGRVLSTEQLKRTDLAPQWIEGEASIYGLQVDLMQLVDNDLQLSEDELREKAEDLDQKVITINERISALEKQLNDCHKLIKAQILLIEESKQASKQNGLNLDQLKTQKNHLNDKKQRAIKAFNLSCEARLKQLKKAQKKNAEQIKDFNDQKQDERLELQSLMLEQRMIAESDRDCQLDELASQLQKIEKSATDRLRDYKKQNKLELTSIDPDGEVDKRMKQRSMLEDALTECAVYARKAREYETFINERYKHRDEMVEVNQHRELEKRGFENSLEDLLIEKNKEIQENKKLFKKLTVQSRQTEELLTQLSLSQRSCEKSGIEIKESSTEPNNEADLSVSFCFDWLKQFEVLEKRLSEQLKTFNDKFKKEHASSELFENWQKLVADNDHFEGARNLFKYREPIMDLLSSAQQKQKNTYQLVTVNATMINEFYQHIENFGRRIKSIGKQLSKNVTALAHFDALADINVYTVMKQEELEYWGPLQQFAKLFEKYRDDLREGMGDIPDELVFAMKKLSKYLPSEGFVLAHHDLFDIEFSISEKGQLKYARNARQLKKISSTGLSYLAMLSLFAGILGMLRGESEFPSTIILPVDELGELAAENVDLLLKMFSDNSICMLSASPSTDRHILSLYKRHYKIKDNKIFHAQIPLSRIDELLAMRAQQQKELGAAHV
jgi:hypothetical protein